MDLTYMNLIKKSTQTLSMILYKKFRHQPERFDWFYFNLSFLSTLSCWIINYNLFSNGLFGNASDQLLNCYNIFSKNIKPFSFVLKYLKKIIPNSWPQVNVYIITCVKYLVRVTHNNTFSLMHSFRTQFFYHLIA